MANPAFSRVVAATDFSSSADRATARAGLLASALRLPLELLHVVSESGLASLRLWIREPADLSERLQAVMILQQVNSAASRQALETLRQTATEDAVQRALRGVE